MIDVAAAHEDSAGARVSDGDDGSEAASEEEHAAGYAPSRIALAFRREETRRRRQKELASIRATEAGILRTRSAGIVAKPSVRRARWTAGGGTMRAGDLRQAASGQPYGVVSARKLPPRARPPRASSPQRARQRNARRDLRQPTRRSVAVVDAPRRRCPRLIGADAVPPPS